jgi:hypothetical protein
MTAGFFAAFAFAATADAAPKKRSVSPEAQAFRGEAGVIVRRSRTRITVTRRSYLDPGTEVRQGSKHYTDYVFSPNYHRPSSDIADPTRSFTSLPEPFWLRGERVPNWGY